MYRSNPISPPPNQIGSLREYQYHSTGDGNWREGALTKNRIIITADSLISANDEDGTGDVKVFYNTKNDSDVTVPAVAWVQLGAETWSSRIIGEWK
ncbi:hypothetical protein MMC22_002657 [Lobaria immixta]|nr:hypothetical protein [Lobaria immixta]